MKQDVRDRLNKRLIENDMSMLNNEPINQVSLEQAPNHLPNDYYSPQEPIYNTRPTFLESIVPGNEQLLIVLIFGIAAYALYLHSKSKD